MRPIFCPLFRISEDWLNMYQQFLKRKWDRKTKDIWFVDNSRRRFPIKTTRKWVNFQLRNKERWWNKWETPFDFESISSFWRRKQIVSSKRVSYICVVWQVLDTFYNKLHPKTMLGKNRNRIWGRRQELSWQGQLCIPAWSIKVQMLHILLPAQ
jgi:hypothetical protein